jgi:hypothetical protein
MEETEIRVDRRFSVISRKILGTAYFSNKAYSSSSNNIKEGSKQFSSNSNRIRVSGNNAEKRNVPHKFVGNLVHDPDEMQIRKISSIWILSLMLLIKMTSLGNKKPIFKLLRTNLLIIRQKIASMLQNCQTMSMKMN